MNCRLQGVEKRFGAQRIFHNLSVELLAGDVVLVQGPNGAGKSTFLRLFAGLESPDAGEVLTERCGYLGHQPALFPDLTVAENIESFGFFLQSDSRVVTQLFELSRLQHRAVCTLSRGQLQRVMLAVAFLSFPNLLLLDEPSTGLDSEARRLLHRAIGAWRDARPEGVLVLATHDPHRDEWCGLRATRTFAIERGTLVEVSR